MICTATGAAFSSQALQLMDFLTPCLKALLGFLGFRTVDVVTVEGTTVDEAAFTRSLTIARQTIERLTTV